MKIVYIRLGDKRLTLAGKRLIYVPCQANGIIYPYHAGFMITDYACVPRLFLYKEQGKGCAFFSSVCCKNERLRILPAVTLFDSHYFGIESMTYNEWMNLAAGVYRYCSVRLGKLTDKSLTLSPFFCS